MPFKVINALNSGKTPQAPENFDAWLTNVHYSLFLDTLYHAQIMNLNSELDKDIQLSYYINTIVPSKRWRKWPKKDLSNNLKLLQDVFGYSELKAKAALAVLSKDQIMEIKKYNKKE
jgi:hypothetical protein